MKTLLQKARGYEESRTPARTRGVYTTEEVELALAWAFDEITIAGVAAALDCGKGSVGSLLASLLRQAVRDGKLVRR
jgi:hypothetical protein